jgi:hypothetical protein
MVLEARSLGTGRGNRYDMGLQGLYRSFGTGRVYSDGISLHGLWEQVEETDMTWAYMLLEALYFDTGGVYCDGMSLQGLRGPVCGYRCRKHI